MEIDRGASPPSAVPWLKRADPRADPSGRSAGRAPAVLVGQRSVGQTRPRRASAATAAAMERRERAGSMERGGDCIEKRGVAAGDGGIDELGFRWWHRGT